MKQRLELSDPDGPRIQRLGSEIIVQQARLTNMGEYVMCSMIKSAFNVCGLIVLMLLVLCTVGFAASVRVEAENYAAMSGIQLDTCSEGGQNIGYINNGDWAEYSLAISAAGKYQFDFRVASNVAIGTLAGRVNLVAGGTTISTIDIYSTGGWQVWTTVSTTATFASAGVQTLRLNFVGVTGYLFNINWFQYDYNPTANLPPSVQTGPKQTVRFDQTTSTTLDGHVYDDDPNNLGQIGVDYGTIGWSCPANPGVVFADPCDLQTMVTFPLDGYYLLELYAQDEVGNEATSGVIINVLVPGQFENRLIDLVNLMTVTEEIQELKASSSAGVGRLGLPSYNYWSEALHGVVVYGATSFPQPIGLGAMWDDDLLFEISSAISDEARVKANTSGKGLTYWSPNINLARDPRWGRNEETYSEDPYLLSRMAVAFIKGMQGDDATYLKTVATPKHFIANNTETGRHSLSSDVDARNLRELYMPAFKAAVTEGQAFSVMAAYNALNGIPCPANTWLLMDVLRGEWGFEGYVVSDCGAIADIYTGHDYASSEAQACAMGINGGTDLNCGSYYQSYLEDAYNQGLVTKAAIDNAVQNVLRARFRLGEFDPPALVSYKSIPASKLDSQEHRDLALLAAQKSMVLLKNDGILPLDKNSIGSIAVIGPNAGRAILGGYSGTPPYSITPLAGIEQKVQASGISVQYLPGCTVELSELPIESQYLKPLSGSVQNGLTGKYYNNITLSGTAVLTRLDSSIDFNWAEGSPGASVNSDMFSVRWSGVLIPPKTRSYRIGSRSDDGFRLYLDGQLIAENWSSHGLETTTATVSLNAGQEYAIVMEYYENAASAVAQLIWDYKTSDLSAAVNLAAACDVAIVCVGTDLDVASEGHDMDQYQMPGLQEQMIQEIYAVNPNTVVVLINGNPIGFEWTAENVPAILEAWYGGQSQGTAIADILFGDYNPGGKLPQTFYKSQSQLPDFFDYNIINNPRTYQYFEGMVLYPFGHGLSYTQFEYSNVYVTPTKIDPNGEILVSVDVENTGAVAGDEVVQVYVRDPIATVKMPIRSLKGFKRIHLQPGEKVTKSFTIAAKDLAFFDTSLNDFRVEPGEFQVHIGSSSADIRETGFFWVNGTYATYQEAYRKGYRFIADICGPLGGRPDCHVDLNDFVVLAKQWLSNSPFLGADMSGPAGLPDGTVDIWDLEILASRWLNCSDPRDPTCEF